MSEIDRDAVPDELLTEILRRDTSVEVLLERYPEHAGDLRQPLRTALHMDHIQGLAFFNLLYHPDLDVHLWGLPQLRLSCRRG